MSTTPADRLEAGVGGKRTTTAVAASSHRFHGSCCCRHTLFLRRSPFLPAVISSPSRSPNQDLHFYSANDEKREERRKTIQYLCMKEGVINSCVVILFFCTLSLSVCDDGFWFRATWITIATTHAGSLLYNYNGLSFHLQNFSVFKLPLTMRER